LIPGTLLSLSPLATVSPNSSWYRPNPNTYQNTTVITINRTRTNISLKFENGSIRVNNATRTSLIATSEADLSYILFKNTIPEYANRNVNFTVDGVFFANSTADASGFISLNHTKSITSGSSHTFEWTAFTPITPGDEVSGDLNGDGVVDEKDVVIVNQHMGNLTWPPFPNYDVNQDGIVDIYDMQFVTGKIPPSLIEQVVNFLKSLV